VRKVITVTYTDIFHLQYVAEFQKNFRNIYARFFFSFAVNCVAYMTFSAVFKNNVFKYVLHSSGKQP